METQQTQFLKHLKEQEDKGKKENSVSTFFACTLCSLNVSIKSSAAADLLHDHSGLACSLAPVTQQDHHTDEINRGCKH